MEWEQAGATSSGTSSAPNRKRGGKRRGCLVVVAVVVLVAIIGSISRCANSAPEKLSWPTSGLAAMLPDPPTEYGSVSINNDESFSAALEQCSSDTYVDYQVACVEKGYSVDADQLSSSYTAYNSEGYYLRLSYLESSQRLDVYLDAPVELEQIVWPTSGPGALVPAPASLRGKITTDSSSQLSVTIGDTDTAAMQAYVDACMAAGFTVDYSKSDTSFSADDMAGNSVSITYKGFNTMGITVKAASPAEDAATPVDATTADAADTPAAPEAPASDGGTSDIHATMDAYEAFMDEYIAFMTKYRDEGNPVSMLADYTSMMARYAEMADKIDGMDESSMSADDWAYYLEVVNRVNQKLINASLS